jgi:hypothetical protein
MSYQRHPYYTQEVSPGCLDYLLYYIQTVAPAGHRCHSGVRIIYYIILRWSHPQVIGVIWVSGLFIILYSDGRTRRL